MKKILFASAFALMGTFAFANETKQNVATAECWEVSVERCGVGFVYEHCGSFGSVVEEAYDLYDEMGVFCN